MYCVRCGAPNPDDSRFCSKCGAAVPAHGAAPAAGASPPHVAHAQPASAAATSHPPPPPHNPPPHSPLPPPPVRAAAEPAPGTGFVFPTVALAKIQDRAGARAHIMAGFVAAVAGIIFSFIAMTAFGPIMLLVAAFYAAIAFGLWKSSRVAAVLGLLVTVGNTLGLIGATKGQLVTWLAVLLLVLIVAYWNAVRGTFAEHRLTEGRAMTA